MIISRVTREEEGKERRARKKPRNEIRREGFERCEGGEEE
jgi:hypothetical protein